MMTTQTLKEFIEARCVALDRDIFMMMWDVIEGDEWVFLKRDFIKSSLITDTEKNGVYHFYIRILAPFVERGEAKQVSRPNDGIKYAAGTQFYAVTKKAFITLLCTAKTPRAARCMSYLYELQHLMVQYYKSQYEDYKAAVNEMIQIPSIVNHTRACAIAELEAIISEKNRIGIIYFIHEDGDFEYFKIGYTFNLKERICQLQVGSRRKLKCYKHIYSSNPNTLEAHIHQMCKTALVHGEWYMINKASVDEIYEQFK